ncbi:MAG: hypothetical protein HOV94_19820 [Saccharothrix sp.]|nr:hypothetical protein [Saccharothrix sp.]
MPVVQVPRDDQYVLNHTTRFLARDAGEVSEPFHLPVVDTHWDGSSAEASYRFNDVTFAHRDDRAAEVGVVGTFGDLHSPVPLRQVRFLDEPTGLWAVTVRVGKGQVHRYLFVVDGRPVLDPVNPQRLRSDNGQEWSRFFTHGCATPISFDRWELRLLERLVTQVLPFQLAENRRFLADFYQGLTRSERDRRFPLAFLMDESVGVVNFIDKLLAREERHNLDDYKTCLRLVDEVLRARFPDREPAELGRQAFMDLYDQLAANSVPGWDTGRYGEPRHFLVLLRRHAMTGAFAHPKHGGNQGAAAWAYLAERFAFDWRAAIEAPLGRNTDYRG